MKKIYSLILIMTVACGFAFGQAADSALRSKRGYLILPEGDEWALGVSAEPFLRYVGSVFSSDGNNAPAFQYTTAPADAGFAVFGKKMIDANSAYRGRLNITAGTTTLKHVVSMDDLTPDANAPAFVDDWRKTSETQIILSLGKEFRRGKGRVQGVYGAEAVVGFNSGKTKYEYGNPFSTDFNNPTSFNFDGNAGGGNRVTEIKTGKRLLVGARAFAGVEYFIAPKISLGGEFGYLLSLQTTGKTYTTVESWNGTTNSVRKTKIDSYGNNGFSYYGIGLDNLSASINLLFYF